MNVLLLRVCFEYGDAQLPEILAGSAFVLDLDGGQAAVRLGKRVHGDASPGHLDIDVLTGTGPVVEGSAA